MGEKKTVCKKRCPKIQPQMAGCWRKSGTWMSRTRGTRYFIDTPAPQDEVRCAAHARAPEFACRAISRLNPHLLVSGKIKFGPKKLLHLMYIMYILAEGCCTQMHQQFKPLHSVCCGKVSLGRLSLYGICIFGIWSEVWAGLQSAQTSDHIRAYDNKPKFFATWVMRSLDSSASNAPIFPADARLQRRVY